MEESSAEEMRDIEIPPIPPVNVEMKIDDAIVIPPEDDNSATFNEYKKEMLENGLESADLEYLSTAYKKLEDVRFIKIHCSSCDKHIGSAPNDLQNRYEHPLLKVLVCGECFQFYSSGDFEKDEDGSELYCRWCGEGGQVFCCTKCPFVFCKRCIRRNLGRPMAKIIENSDNWMCFSCDSSQISRHRATYWAVQKYSEQMIQKAKIIGDTSILAVDDNICCTPNKKRSDVYNKLVQPPRKRQRMNAFSPLQQIGPMKMKNKKNKIRVWQPPSFAQQPEDEVICTPDIIPLDESPPHSPERATPPPMIPLMQQAIPPIPVPMAVGPPKVPPLIIRPPVQRSMNILDLQKHLQQNYTQLVLTPRPKLTGKPANANNQAQAVLLRNNTPQNNGNYKFVLNSTPTPSNVSNSNFVIGPGKPHVSNTQTPTTSKQNTNKQISTLKVNTINNSNQDWFDKAVIDCAEITEYIATKISSLAGVHTRAYKSEKLMIELHNTFQTYMQVANEKINKIRRVMQQNYEDDIHKHFVQKQSEKMVNPFARKKNIGSDKQSNVSSFSEDSNSNSRDSFKNSNKTGYVLTKNIQPEEVLFDMDVTNASDEDSRSAKNEEHNDDDSDNDVQHIEDKSRNEVIEVIDSDDEMEGKDETFIIPNDILEKIKNKHNIQNMSSKELLKYLTPVVIATPKTSEEIEELSDLKKLLQLVKLQRNVENKLITSIQKLSEDPDNALMKNADSENNTLDSNENEKEMKTTNGEISKIVNKKENKITNEEDETINKERNKTKNEKGNQITNEEENKIKEKDNKITSEQSKTTSDSENKRPKKDSIFDKSVIRNEIDKLANEESTMNNSNNSQESDKESGSTDKVHNELSEYNEGNNSDVEDEPYDIEDILGSNVVVKSNQSLNTSSFGDAFSKFVCTNVPKPEVNEPGIPAPEGDDISDTINIARELDIIPDYVNDICNRDNGSLSLPPDSITSISTNDIEMLMNKDTKGKDTEVLNNKSDSEVILNNEILALQQMAENCVNNTDEHKNSTECKG